MKVSGTYAQLKEMLANAGDGLSIKNDTEEEFYLNTNKMVRSKEFLFGAIYQKPKHVSFHFFPLYTNPELKEGLSQELQKALQGKTCFNFKKGLDEKALEELRNLTQKGYQLFLESDYIDQK